MSVPNIAVLRERAATIIARASSGQMRAMLAGICAAKNTGDPLPADSTGQELITQCQGIIDQAESDALAIFVRELMEFVENATIGGSSGPPVFEGPNPGAGTESVLYQGQIIVSGTLPMTYAVDSGTLPPGTSLNVNTGLISGIATVGGNYDFTIRATNSAGTATQDFSVAISGVLPSFFMAPLNVPYTSGYALYCSWATKTLVASTEALGTTYDWVDMHTVAGYPDSYFGTPTVTWSTEPIPTQPSPTVTGLPDGLSINATTGYIEGTPTNVAQFSGANTFYFYVVATNPVGVTRVEYLIFCDP